MEETGIEKNNSNSSNYKNVNEMNHLNSQNNGSLLPNENLKYLNSQEEIKEISSTYSNTNNYTYSSSNKLEENLNKNENKEKGFFNFKKNIKIILFYFNEIINLLIF